MRRASRLRTLTHDGRAYASGLGRPWDYEAAELNVDQSVVDWPIGP
jgi:hypothetical protein